MRRHTAPLLALALALGTVTPAVRAQDAATTPLRLTLAEALRRAAEDPPAVHLALARAAASRAQIDVAQAAYYPSVTFGLNGSGSASMSGAFSRSNGTQVTVGVPVGTGLNELASDSQGTSFRADANITGRVPIWDFGRTSNAVGVAERGAAAARADGDLARVQAMSAVGAAFLTVLSDQEAAAAARAILAQREAHLHIAEGLVAAGARPPIEQTRARVNLDVARLDLTRSEGRILNDQVVLAAALGVDPVRTLELVPPEPGALTADEDPAHAAEAALRARPELVAARLRVAQAEAQVAAARAGRAPILAGQASVTGGSSAVMSSTDSQRNGQEIPQSTITTDRLEGAVTLSLSLSMPLFDPTVSANVRAAEANVATARASLAQQSLQVRSTAAQAALSARIARLALEQAERLSESAAANLDQANGRYQSGAAPLLEIIDAQAADASARAQVITARLALHMAQVNLLAVTGEIGRLTR